MITTFPYCHECPSKAVGEFIVKAFGEKRGVRAALCAHHKAMLEESLVYTVRVAK